MKDWSPEQLAAIDRLEDWRRSGGKSFMTLGGYAGTGKSTIVAHLAEIWPFAAVCAYTGKAAAVLKSKGVHDAQTLHSLIYRPYEGADGKVRFKKQHGISERLIIVDEASMIGKWTHEDMMSFGVPVLYVGDHGQLEPIASSDLNLMKAPDIRLEQIHRQAADNPILRIAAAFREGRQQQVMDAHRKGWRDSSGRIKLVSKSKHTENLSGQVICGLNATRHNLNKLLRQRKGLTGNLPSAGDKIICLQNNYVWQMFNGQQFDVLRVGQYGKFIDITVMTEDGRTVGVECLREQFGRDKVADHKDKRVVLFDFAYAITCHKAQGSQWPEVTVIEEGSRNWDMQRWRYTAVTRAAERLVYCG